MGVDTGPQQRIVAGRYAVGEVLGRGGMGTVWLATDKVLQRQVALKEVTFSIHLTDEEREVLRERTMREARAAARLDHPCVTHVFDVVEEDGRPWLVMEHVSSRSLQEIVEEQGPLPPHVVARIGLDVLAALEAAHAEGIVHRDVKPANVLVAPDGRARLTDFGIATTTGDSSLTTQGALIGSPSYMAPERAAGGQPGGSVDLWSLGATLYTAVEGRLAFDRGDPVATLMAVATEPPAPPRLAGPLTPVLLGLLTKDPAQRATPAQARRDLQAVAAGSAPTWTPGPPPGPPPSRPGPPPQAAAPAGPAVGSPPPERQVPRAPAVERIDADDLRRLAEASRAVLGSVARDSARYLARRAARGGKEARRTEQPAHRHRPSGGRATGRTPARRDGGSSGVGSSCPPWCSWPWACWSCSGCCGCWRCSSTCSDDPRRQCAGTGSRPRSRRNRSRWWCASGEWTTVTGQVACRMHCRLVEPSSTDEKPPCPRLPSTSRSAPCDCRISTSAAAPCAARIVTSARLGQSGGHLVDQGARPPLRLAAQPGTQPVGVRRPDDVQIGPVVRRPVGHDHLDRHAAPGRVLHREPQRRLRAGGAVDTRDHPRPTHGRLVAPLLLGLDRVRFVVHEATSSDPTTSSSAPATSTTWVSVAGAVTTASRVRPCTPVSSTARRTVASSASSIAASPSSGSPGSPANSVTASRCASRRSASCSAQSSAE